MDPIALARALVDIDSTTGREAEAATWIARDLRERGYEVTEQPVSDGRFNIFARLGAASRQGMQEHLGHQRIQESRPDQAKAEQRSCSEPGNRR